MTTLSVEQTKEAFEIIRRMADMEHNHKPSTCCYVCRAQALLMTLKFSTNSELSPTI